MQKGNYIIDKVVREKFEPYADIPPAEVWDGIIAELNQENKNRRLMIIKWSVAASIAVLFSLGSLWVVFQPGLNHKKHTADVVYIKEIKKESQSEKPLGDLQKENLMINKNQPQSPIIHNIVETTKNAPQIAVNEPVKEKIYTSPAGNNKIQQEIAASKENTEKADFSNTDLVAEKTMQPMKTEILPVNNEKFNVENNYNGDLLKSIEENEPENNDFQDLNYNYLAGEPILLGKKEKQKWTVGGHLSPTYNYRHVKSVEEEAYTAFLNDNESGIVAYAGGVNVQYHTRSRWTIRSGVYYSKMGMNVENTVQSNRFKNGMPIEYVSNYEGQINLKNSAGNLEVDKKSSSSYSYNTMMSAEAVYENNDLVSLNEIDYFIQEFEMLEVPVMVSYRLIDRRVGVNLSGGLGASLLVGNNLKYKYENKTEDLGTTEGVNTVNYNTSVSLGLDYKLSKKVKFTLEPSFRYFLNSMNQDAEIELHPYSLGMFTGVSYSF